MRSVETVLLLIVIAAAVATFAKRLRVPAPSLLVVVGVLVGLLPGVPAVEVTPEIISLVVLPPLLFAAGEELPWRDLRAVWRPVTALAIGLVVASAVAVGAVATAITPLAAGMAFVLGTVLASTDPVAVTALGRRLSLPPRVQALVQAESLFNDVTSLLLFRVALSATIVGGALTFAHTAGEFVVLAGGGIAAGAAVAGVVWLIRRRTEDPVLETVATLVTPYGSYVLAEAVHASGVTAVVVASVILGTQATRLTTAPVRLQTAAVFQPVIFVLESVVFGLIGLQLPALIRESADAVWPLQALAIAATLMVVRILWVFPVSALQNRRKDGRRPSWQVPAVVSWAGARGVVPLAAALSIPLTTTDGAPVPHRDLVLLLATAVIVITLVVQGFTLAPLVRRAGIAVTPADLKHEDTMARLRLAQAGLAYLQELAESKAAPDVLIDHMRRQWEARLQRLEATDGNNPSTTSLGATYRQLRRDLLHAESNELLRLFETGVISDSTRRRIQRRLDLEEASIADDEP